MSILTKKCRAVYTKDSNGDSNGWILEIASDLDGFTKHMNGQVYLTVVKPGLQKGFHLHKLKTNYITCIRGKVIIGVYDGKKVKSFKIGQDNWETVKVLPGQPLAIYNRGKIDAYVINCCTPAFNPQVKEQEEVDIDWDCK